MCLLIFAWRLCEEYAVIVGANRDEQFSRPARSFDVLRSEGPRTLGGRDEVAGGTWLAINEFGLVAGLTNRPLRAGPDPSKRSRGELPLLLTTHRRASDGVDEFLDRVRPGEYNPAWMLVGDREALFYLEISGEGEVQTRNLSPGLHILENAPLGAMSNKVRGVEKLLKVGADDGATLWQGLPSVLSSHAVPDGTAADVADGGSVMPVATRSPCVHGELYGTRSSTLLRVAADSTRLSSVLVADGPPCTSPYVDQTGAWVA